ncbi:MAG: hypothetical protein JST47_04890 [Bacteroidetes bacterium]|nr:hypothetical protein [Bacteroidota bacterium]
MFIKRQAVYLRNNTSIMLNNRFDHVINLLAAIIIVVVIIIPATSGGGY